MLQQRPVSARALPVVQHGARPTGSNGPGASLAERMPDSVLSLPRHCGIEHKVLIEAARRSCNGLPAAQEEL
jgi:hypothetical protein